MTYRLYLDVCCLNRPFDDWAQARVRIEAEAILAILAICQTGAWQLVSSMALLIEIDRTANLERKQGVLDSLAMAVQQVSITEAILQRADVLKQSGFKAFDALHLACAEAASVDCFLTTDDRLIRRAARTDLAVSVSNPVDWFMKEATTDETEPRNSE